MARYSTKKAGRNVGMYLDGHTADIVGERADAVGISVAKYCAGIIAEYVEASDDGTVSDIKKLVIDALTVKPMRLNDLGMTIRMDQRSVNAVAKTLYDQGVLDRVPVKGLNGNALAWLYSIKPAPVKIPEVFLKPMTRAEFAAAEARAFFAGEAEEDDVPEDEAT